jgi:toxin ParE1/3/4
VAARVEYKAAAEAEIGDIFRDYQQQRQGLGVDFLDELARIEGHLQANPALYQRVDGDMRRAVLRRFPYGLFYVIDGGRVNVLACLHLHREPRSRDELLARS